MPTQRKPRLTGIARRDFLLRGAAGALLAGRSYALRPQIALAAEKSSAADAVPGKQLDLIVHGTEPLELETPVKLLREHRITPPELLFVRNNGRLAGADALAPLPLMDWKIEIAGQVEFPRVLDAARLRDMPQVEHEIVLQCSGNGRALFNQVAPVKGSPWSRGAMGNVRFQGVPLAVVLKQSGCTVVGNPQFVTAEGKDAPLSDAKADFEHSIPLADALERSFLAIEMNGQAIPAVHGGPVRLITPGFYGTMNVKWLTRLRLEGQETANHNQLKRYRTPKTPIPPGSKFDYTFANSEPNWRLRTKSVIFRPLEGERLAAGPIEISGVAFNDGDAPMEAVLVSTDGGGSWRAAAVEKPAGPYSWYWWKLRTELPKGRAVIRSRAIDALGRSQPLDAASTWNPDGYAFNGVDAVSVQIA